MISFGEEEIVREADVLKIENLQIFIEVAKTESFTEVAERNYMTSRGVSKIISNIEEELDMQLFNRDSNKIYLNDNGQFLFQKALTLTKNYEQLLIDIEEYKNNKVKSLKLGYVSPYDGMYLFQLADKYKLNHPNINIYTQSLAIEELKKEVKFGAVDIGIVVEFSKSNISFIEDKDIKEIELFTEDLVVGMSHHCHLNNYEEVSIQNILDKSVYYYISNNSSYIEEEYRNVDPMLAQFQNIYNENSFDNMLMNVSLNNGITFLTERGFDSVVKDNYKISIRPISDMPGMKMTTKLLVNNEKFNVPYINTFINDLVQR